MKTTPWLPLLVLAAAGCMHGRGADPVDPPEPPAANPVLAQFSCDTGFAGWRIENGAVPADRPQPLLVIAESGNAVFTGDGSASIHCDYHPELDVSAYRAIHLGLKGDGRRYQLRLDSARRDRHSYAADFPTSGDWQEIVLPFADFAAAGPDPSRFPGQTLARVRILAGDGRAASFRLEIDRIWLEE